MPAYQRERSSCPNTSISVEIASHSESRSTGLSYRDGLPRNAGMLFLMPREGVQTFWMKEMRFPLDMVWIGADCRVTGVTHDVPFPEAGTSTSELPRYKSPDGTLYVLEINAGLSPRAWRGDWQRRRLHRHRRSGI